MDSLSGLRVAALGPVYQSHKRLIDASKSWSIAETKEYQAQKTWPLLERYGGAIHTKEHYRANLDRYTTLSLPGLTKRVSTGGTTGTPFTFYVDTFARRQKERAYIFDIWSEVGYRPFDLRVIYRGNIGTHLISYKWFENAYAISPAQLNADTIDFIVRFLRKLPPFFLHVYPSSLLSLIGLLGEETMRSLPIRGILAGSESFPRTQMLAAELALGAPISHWYGHSEYATIARYCRACDGFHFYPTYGYTEFVMNDSGVSNIVCTSFNRIGTHFVRYDTGDTAVLTDRLCFQPFRRVETILGRAQEYFIGRDGVQYAFGPFLFGIHNKFWELTRAVQFIHRKIGALIVRIAFKESTSPAEREWVQDFLRTRFRSVDLVFIIVNSIESTASGKHRYYINELSIQEPDRALSE